MTDKQPQEPLFFNLLRKKQKEKNLRSTGGTDKEVMEKGFDTEKDYMSHHSLLSGALKSLKVLPVGFALTALDTVEKLLDENFSFTFNCRHRNE